MILRWLAGAALAALSFSASAETFDADVVRVIDGDTVVVLSDTNAEIKVRLAGIDCPEKRGNQPFWRSAKSELSNLLGNSRVLVNHSKTDRWGRVIGVVQLGSLDTGAEMIRLGLCWHFKRYEREQSASDRRIYSGYEKAARAGNIGLWEDPRAISPWNWRKGKRTAGAGS